LGRRIRMTMKRFGAGLALVCVATLVALTGAAAGAQSRTITISKRYLNVPVARASAMKVFHIRVDGVERREFPVQLAEQQPDYWIFLDVREFRGKTIELSGPGSQAALDRVYQADKIEGWQTLYKESGRPQFHFTVKRGWNND